jgi:hypothetical protein
MIAEAQIETIPMEPIRLRFAVGNIWEEHIYQPPPAPADRTLILLNQFVPADQYWRHDPEEMHEILGLPQLYFDWNETTLLYAEKTTYDREGVLIALSVDDTIMLAELRDRELKRRQEGIHIFINGKIVYLTGDNYNFLVYYIIPDAGHPQYRAFQRDCFYIIDIADKNPYYLGAIFPKAKKTGLSHIITSCFINRATMIRNRAFGVLNKTQDEANDLNINFFWQGYEEYPPIMKPNVSHKNMHMIRFGNPLVKYTGTKASVLKAVYQQRNKALNTWVYSAPTSPKLKFDGPLMYWIHVDEFLKIDKLSEIVTKLKETVKKQQTVIGKLFFTSYPPEEDGPGFFAGKELCMESLLHTIDHDSIIPTTQSGFILWMVDALVSTDGTFDKYGEANIQHALALNQAERDRCKNSTELQAKLRQYPRNFEEAFREGGSGSTFNNNHLALGINHIEELQRTQITPLFIDGDLSWTNGRFSQVQWTPVSEEEKKTDKRKGWWRLYESYGPQYHNRVYRNEKGEWAPRPDSPFISSTDPTEYKTKSSVEKTNSKPSDSAIVAMSFLDMQRNTLMRRVASKIVVLEYLGRREDPDEYLEDLILTVFWLGCYVLIEANKAWVVTEFEKLGLQNFLLVRRADRTIVPYNMNDDANIPITTTNDVIETYCRLGNSYLRVPVADDIDYVMAMRSLRLIKQLMAFNPNDTKKYDLAVCFLLCLLAMHAFSAFYDELKKKEKALDSLSVAYNAIMDLV